MIIDKVLVAYYSFSGSTWMLAESIAEITGGTLMELTSELPYSFDYSTASKEVRSQIERGYCPKLSSGNEPIDEYDAIFIGTPNWFKSVAPPVLTFIRLNNFAGKTVIPFCTHGGGGFGEIEDVVARECIGTTLLPGLASSGDISEVEVSAWLKQCDVYLQKNGANQV